jgi:hypothetical protein
MACPYFIGGTNGVVERDDVSERRDGAAGVAARYAFKSRLKPYNSTVEHVRSVGAGRAMHVPSCGWPMRAS